MTALRLMLLRINREEIWKLLACKYFLPTIHSAFKEKKRIKVLYRQEKYSLNFDSS